MNKKNTKIQAKAITVEETQKAIKILKEQNRPMG